MEGLLMHPDWELQVLVGHRAGKQQEGRQGHKEKVTEIS